MPDFDLRQEAHGAYVWRGVNAIEIAARVIQRIKAHRFKHRVHPLLRGPTTNIGKIAGGDKVNIVADFCAFALDLRFLPGMNPADILKTIRQIVRNETRNFKIEIDSLQQPFEISPGHPLVRAYFKAARAMGVPVLAKGSEGATVMTFLGDCGIPAFATGYGSCGTAHTTDEYAVIENLYRGAGLLARFIKDYDDYDDYDGRTPLS